MPAWIALSFALMVSKSCKCKHTCTHHAVAANTQNTLHLQSTGMADSASLTPHWPKLNMDAKGTFKACYYFKLFCETRCSARSLCIIWRNNSQSEQIYCASMSMSCQDIFRLLPASIFHWESCKACRQNTDTARTEYMCNGLMDSKTVQIKCKRWLSTCLFTPCAFFSNANPLSNCDSVSVCNYCKEQCHWWALENKN